MQNESSDPDPHDWAISWENGTGLIGIDQPEVVDAAFDREERHVGAAVIGLALNHPDPAVILPRVARAMGGDSAELRRQGTVALAHVARLHRTVDQTCLTLLRGMPRGNEADDDLWTFVPHRRLPPWLWRHQVKQRIKWQLWERRRY
ncbi:hypothetical protein [Streptomyces sp. NPDC002133]|uniref:hypothetical protein n=1 Tax=Streptomyces sp. NPDC002133 TaxID=3154409 RepID=UPI00331FED4C